MAKAKVVAEKKPAASKKKVEPAKKEVKKKVESLPKIEKTEKKVSKTARVEEKTVSTKKVAKQKVDYSIDLRELLEAGCHFGHQARRWNPKMTEYIYTERDGVHIFDLAISAAQIVKSMEFVRDWVAGGKDIVFVGTKRQASAIVLEEALRVGAPHVTVRWLGGTMTNWGEMKKRIRRLIKLKEQREEGDLEKKYTKKERVLLDREISRLERFFGGISHLPSRPEALFVVDTHREITAVKEANILEVPVVGMVDSNSDPEMVDYVIPVNDDAVRSIKLVVTKIADAYAEGMRLRGKNKPAVEAKQTDKKKSVVGGKVGVGKKK